MKAIVHKDQKQQALYILGQQFIDVPGVKQLVHRKNRSKGVAAICAFCLKESMDDGLAFLSNDERAVALLTRNPARFKLRRWFRMLPIARHATGLKGILPALRFMKNKDAARSKEQGLYFLMLASLASPDQLSSAVDLKNEIFNLADQEELPIFLEASVKKNMLGYHRYGFRTYHLSEPNDNRPFPFWYMRRSPVS